MLRLPLDSSAVKTCDSLELDKSKRVFCTETSSNPDRMLLQYVYWPHRHPDTISVCDFNKRKSNYSQQHVYFSTLLPVLVNFNCPYVYSTTIKTIIVIILIVVVILQQSIFNAIETIQIMVLNCWS